MASVPRQLAADRRQRHRCRARSSAPVARRQRDRYRAHARHSRVLARAHDRAPRVLDLDRVHVLTRVVRAHDLVRTRAHVPAARYGTRVAWSPLRQPIRIFQVDLQWLNSTQQRQQTEKWN